MRCGKDVTSTRRNPKSRISRSSRSSPHFSVHPGPSLRGNASTLIFSRALGIGSGVSARDSRLLRNPPGPQVPSDIACHYAHFIWRKGYARNANSTVAPGNAAFPRLCIPDVHNAFSVTDCKQAAGRRKCQAHRKTSFSKSFHDLPRLCLKDENVIVTPRRKPFSVR